MTYETARKNILARSEIRISADKNGRSMAHYFSRAAHRWVKISMEEAQIAQAVQG